MICSHKSKLLGAQGTETNKNIKKYIDFEALLAYARHFSFC